MTTKKNDELNEVESVEINKVAKADKPIEAVKATKTAKTVKTVKADKAVETGKTEKKVGAVKATEPVKTKAKRLSKSTRAHVRKMKAEARIAGTVYRPGIQ